jgi:hypothetical protein
MRVARFFVVVTVPLAIFGLLGTSGAAAAVAPHRQVMPYSPANALSRHLTSAMAEDLPDDTIISRTPNSDTYDLGDGLRITELSTEPINVATSDGEWTGISTTAVKNTDGTLSVPENPLNPQFANSANDAGVMHVSNGKYSLSFTLDDGNSSSKPQRTTPQNGDVNSQVTYRDATSDGSDLVYEIRPGSVKETIVLDAVPVEGSNTWSWVIKAPALILRKNQFGDLIFADKSGTTRFTVPSPVMWDSSAEAGIREAAESPLISEISQRGNGSWRVQITADPEWLKAADRKFPVYVDPTITLGDSNVTSYKSDGATRTDYVHIGNSRDSNTDKYWRAKVNYNYSSLYGKQVLDARLYATYSAGTTTSRTGSVNTSSGSGYNTVGTKLASLTIDTDGSTSDANVDLPTQLSDWIAARSPHTLVIRGAETAGAYTYKQLNTTLKIAWKEFPTITGSVSPSPANGATDVTSPSLNVSISDPGGTETMVQYFVSDDPDPLASQMIVSDWYSPGQFDIPEGTLLPGTTYYWAAQVTDSADGLYGVTAIANSEVNSFTTAAAPASVMSNSLREIVIATEESPNAPLIDDFEWVASAATLRVHYAGDSAPVHAWLDPLLAGYQVEFVEDDYSDDEIQTAMDAFDDSDAYISSISAIGNNEGLLVTLWDPSAGSGYAAALPAEGSSAADPAVVLPDVAPIPVTVVEADQAIEESASRDSDSSPFWGGAAMFHYAAAGSAEFCTTGFAIVKSSTKKMVTAKHCGKVDDVAYVGTWATPGLPNPLVEIGKYQSGNTKSDFNVISGKTYEGYIYIGNFRSKSRIAVKGAYHAVEGDYVCSGGAFSGTVCDIKVIKTGTSIVPTPGTKYRSETQIERSGTAAVFGQGDSGGPIYISSSGGVKIAGVISAIQLGNETNPTANKVACAGPSNPNRQCSTVGYFADEKAFFKANPGWKILTR